MFLIYTVSNFYSLNHPHPRVAFFVPFRFHSVPSLCKSIDHPSFIHFMHTLLNSTYYLSITYIINPPTP